jgi:hypothetical protein
MSVATSPIVRQSELSMISAALVLTGEKPLNSLTDTRYGAQVGAAFFDMIYENELTSNPWRITCTKWTLAQLTSQPANEWRYAFQIPPDCITVLGFWGLDPSMLYDIYGDVIFTNVTSNPGVVPSTLVMEGQFKPDPGTLPSYLSLLVTYALAKRMVKPITESDSQMTKLEQAYNQQRNVAMATDAKQRPNRTLQSQPFIRVR